jgi:hypothetical protein
LSRKIGRRRKLEDSRKAGRKVGRRRRPQVDWKAEPEGWPVDESRRLTGGLGRKVGRRRKLEIDRRAGRRIGQPMRVGGELEGRAEDGTPTQVGGRLEGEAEGLIAGASRRSAGQ